MRCAWCKQAPEPSAATGKANTKRYMILTYAAEFDRAHYPLPLSHDPSPSPEALRRTVERLRSELAIARGAGASGGEAGGGGGGGLFRSTLPPRPGRLAELEDEVAALRASLGLAEAELGRLRGDGPSGAGGVEAQIAEMAEAYERLRGDYETLRGESAREVRRLKAECRGAQAKVAELGAAAAAEGKARAQGEALEAAAQRHRADRLEAALEDERVAHRRADLRREREAARLKARPRPLFPPTRARVPPFP